MVSVGGDDNKARQVVFSDCVISENPPALDMIGEDGEVIF